MLSVESQVAEDNLASNIRARVRIIFNGVTYVSSDVYTFTQSIEDDSSRQVVTVDNFSVPVPANTTGGFYIALEVTSALGSGAGTRSATLNPVNMTNSTIPVQLFTDGGDLG